MLAGFQEQAAEIEALMAMHRSLWNQLCREMQANRQKTVVLGILLLVGLYFWIPPLWRAVAGDSSSRPSAEYHTATTAVALPKLNPGQQTQLDSKADQATAEFHWRQAEKLHSVDRLLQSAEVATIHGDPFRVDPNQFSPPMLFAEDDIENSAAALAAKKDQSHADEWVLKSTIVGSRRRAAYINDKLYFEGKEVSIGGQTYLLASVLRRKVVLTRGAHIIELLLQSAVDSGGIEVQTN